MLKTHSTRSISITAAVLTATAIRRRAAMLAFATASALVLAIPFAATVRAEPAATGFVYTADEFGNTVSRIDLTTEKIDIVPVPITPHNVQFVSGKDLVLAVGLPVAGKAEDAHASNGAGHGGDGHGDAAVAGQLIVLDAADISSGVKASIPVGGHPAHVIADAQGNRAYVSNSEDDSLSVVDLAKGEVVATVGTGDYPHGLRMSPDGSAIYVADVQDGTVSVIDTTALSEVARIKVGVAPVQVGFTPDGKRVYVSLRDENKVAVIDTQSREVIARINVGRSPIQVYATPDGRLVYVANQGTETEPDETVSVIDVVGGNVVKTIQTDKGAHGVTVVADGAFVFVTNIVAGTVSQIDVGSQSVVKTYAVGKGPNGVTYQAQ